LAQELSRVPRQVAALAKTAVWEGLELPMEQGLELERRLAQRLIAGRPAGGLSRARKRRAFSTP